MDPEQPIGPLRMRELSPRHRAGQKFYNELNNLIKTSRKRTCYNTPFIFLLVKQYANRFHLVDVINNTVRWDQSQWKVSPGNLALSLIYLMFVTEDGRIPLYRASEKLRELDLRLLFDDPVQPDDFTGDAYAAMLDRLHEAGCQDIFATIVIQVYQIFPLARDNTLHGDTTSHLMFGAFKLCEQEAYKGLKPGYGHSKDHRPDLKQIKTGLIADGNGIVFDIQVLDGNASDSTWNGEVIGRLQDRLGDHLSSYIYIADSKLVNLKNFREMTSSTTPFYFISLIPANFSGKLSSRLRTRAYDEGNWTELGTCCEHADKKNRESYSVREFTEQIDGHPYRILVYRTSASDSIIEKKLLIESEDLRARAHEKFKKPFACEPDAQKEVDQFLKEESRGKYQAVLAIVPETREKKPVGRPPKNPPPAEYVTVYRVTVEDIVPNNERIRLFRQSEESFVLITNVPMDNLDSRNVLIRYKRQWKVERLFSQLKKPLMVDTIFLKLPERIEALMMLVYIALLFQAIMQAMARFRVQNLFELPKIRYAKQSIENPTFDLLEWLFKPFVVVSDDISSELTWTTDEAGKYLQLLLYLVDVEVN